MKIHTENEDGNFIDIVQEDCKLIGTATKEYASDFVAAWNWAEDQNERAGDSAKEMLEGK